MLIFSLVPPVYIGAFLLATIAASVLHYYSGNHQKITLTFFVVVSAVLWLGNEPWSEPFPGAIKSIVIVATFLQIFVAGLAYWVRQPNPKAKELFNEPE